MDSDNKTISFDFDNFDDSVLEDRFRIVLSGLFFDANRLTSLPIPKKKLLSFVSSTFTDTHAERDVLQRIILPRLRKVARENGVEVVLVDLRFGIPDDAAKFHTTWEDCKREVERCRQESGGIFFISLQAGK